MNTDISKRIKSGIVILLLIIPIVSFCRAGNHDCLITNVNIVDVNTGKILKNKTIAIDNNRITAIYDKEIAGSDSTIVIDGKGKYLIPGLWDMHAHYKWNRIDTEPLLIANGITGVREMWADMPEYVKVPKNTPQEGVVSPDIYFAADFIDGNPPAFPGSLIVTNTEEAIAAVNNQIEKKVDFLKVYNTLTEVAFMAIANEASKRNIPFAGHIPNTVSIYKAIEAGMASSEHLQGFLEGCIPQNKNENSNISMEEFINSFSEERFDSLCSVLAKSNMWLCPTLVVNRANCYLNDSIFINDNRKSYLQSYVIDLWKLQLSAYTQSQIDTFVKSARVRYFFELSLIGKMNEKGVKFIAGTDFPNPYVFPGFSLHDELSLMVKGGMPALDVLKSATLNAAIFMNKRADFGSVEAGKLASLVLLNKNPLENIENTKTIETVIIQGKVYNRRALDLMLEQAKSNAR
ncbi:MAG: amidohydrolase family protein [Bacteroidales bacterium]|nr:amidohydrolase family protein [Bacteroidales bacterium]